MEKVNLSPNRSRPLQTGQFVKHRRIHLPRAARRSRFGVRMYLLPARADAVRPMLVGHDEQNVRPVGMLWHNYLL